MLSNLAHWMARHDVSWSSVLGTVAILAGGSVVILFASRLVRRMLTRLELRLRVPYETVLIVTRVLTAVLWLCLGLLLLNVWGVSVAGLWTVLVSAATVIGVGFLAVWTMVSNVTAQLFITLWRPFRLGHTVEMLPENLKGRVIDRNMMFTVLREEGGTVLQIPNNLFFQKMFRVGSSDQQYLLEFLERSGAPARPQPKRDERQADLLEPPRGRAARP